MTLWKGDSKTNVSGARIPQGGISTDADGIYSVRARPDDPRVGQSAAQMQMGEWYAVRPGCDRRRPRATLEKALCICIRIKHPLSGVTGSQQSFLRSLLNRCLSFVQCTRPRTAFACSYPPTHPKDDAPAQLRRRCPCWPRCVSMCTEFSTYTSTLTPSFIQLLPLPYQTCLPP